MQLANAAIAVAFLALITFTWLQVALFSVGNRSYPARYRSRGLVKRKGLCKLIYFKPQFFHRYRFDEVLMYFASFAVLLVGAVLAPLTGTGMLDMRIGLWVQGGICIALVGYDVLRLIAIDIGRVCEAKYFNPDDNPTVNSYGYIVELEATYAARLARLDPADKPAIDRLDEEYIGYFRNIRRLRIVKTEGIKIEVEIQQRDKRNSDGRR